MTSDLQTIFFSVCVCVLEKFLAENIYRKQKGNYKP